MRGWRDTLALDLKRRWSVVNWQVGGWVGQSHTWEKPVFFFHLSLLNGIASGFGIGRCIGGVHYSVRLTSPSTWKIVWGWLTRWRKWTGHLLQIGQTNLHLHPTGLHYFPMRVCLVLLRCTQFIIIFLKVIIFFNFFFLLLSIVPRFENKTGWEGNFWAALSGDAGRGLSLEARRSLFPRVRFGVAMEAWGNIGASRASAMRQKFWIKLLLFYAPCGERWWNGLIVSLYVLL